MTMINLNKFYFQFVTKINLLKRLGIYNTMEEFCYMDERKKIKECDKLINRYIFRAKKFIEYACFQYGKYKYMLSKKPDAEFISDFQYFVFTKSTKSLESIRKLLDIGHTEDVFVLARTMFEGYIASRYIDERYDDTILNDFIFVPQLISQRKVIYDGENARIRDGNEIIDFIQRNPSDMRLGKDKNYFYDLYGFLCDFAHCNFSTVYYYIDKHDRYTCGNVINEFLTRVIVLFIYTKLFESIVTIEGEDFLNQREEQECYKLVEDATKALFEQLDYLSKYNCKSVNDELNNHMKKMFKEMKKSLKEEIGSVNKDFLIKKM